MITLKYLKTLKVFQNSPKNIPIPVKIKTSRKKNVRETQLLTYWRYFSFYFTIFHHKLRILKLFPVSQLWNTLSPTVSELNFFCHIIFRRPFSFKYCKDTFQTIFFHLQFCPSFSCPSESCALCQCSCHPKGCSCKEI